MRRGLLIFIFILISTIQIQGQSAKTKGIATLPLIKNGGGIQKIEVKKAKNKIASLADDNIFISPQDSQLNLNRQVQFHLLPPGFFPSQETEADNFRKKALRYAVVYYRDCQIPGFNEPKDVLLGLRLDTRNGALDITYYHTALIIDPFVIQFPEDRPAMGVLQDNDSTVLILFFEGSKQELISFEGIFSENPHPANFIEGDDVDGVKANPTLGKFAIFLRGGTNRASLFLLLSDPSLSDIQTFELLRDLPATDKELLFELLPAAVPPLRTVVGSQSKEQTAGMKP